MSPIKISSGVEYLDKLIDRFNIGDNIVWQVETGAFIELFCRAFVKESVKEGQDVIYVSFNNSPKNIVTKLGSCANNSNVMFVDCFTSGKGNNSGLFLDLYKSVYNKYKCKVVHVEKPGDVQNFVSIINSIEEAKPRGARYIFDSLTGMQDLWGSSEEITKFFTRQCPRLYELDTIAYWIMEKNAHDEQFRAKINHITQVVADIAVESGACKLSVIKAENHPESNLLKPYRYEVIGSNIEFLESLSDGVVNIGKKIRDIRLSKEISQAQLAAETGVTPSAISQVENNAISLSLPALLRLTRALNVPVGMLFDEEQAGPAEFIFRAKNRSRNAGMKKGISCDLLMGDKGSGLEVFVVEVAPDVETESHFFSHKGREFAFVISGTLEFDLKGRTYTLNSGDALYFTSEDPDRWRNNSEVPASLLFALMKVV